MQTTIHNFIHRLAAKNNKKIIIITRLNAFTRSCLFNATAVQYRISINQHKLILSHSLGGGTTLETPFSPVSIGKSFMKIRSAVPENGCLIFLTDGKSRKKTKKNKKNICKTYTHPPHRRLRK